MDLERDGKQACLLPHFRGGDGYCIRSGIMREFKPAGKKTIHPQSSGLILDAANPVNGYKEAVGVALRSTAAMKQG